MLEAGWLLLFLFLGICSLIVVSILWPSFVRVEAKRARSILHPRITLHPVAVPSPPTPPVAVQPVAMPPIVAPPIVVPPIPQGLKVLSLAEWMPIVNDNLDDAPHTLVIGTSGTGKTTLAQAITAVRKGLFIILDPKWQPGKWGGLPAVAIDDDGKYTKLEEALKAILAELTARLVSLKQGTTVFEELSIIADELPTLVTECPSASLLLKQIGRLGRELRIRLVGLSQSERVKSLGIAGEGDAKDNFLFIRLGKAAIAMVNEARTQERPAVLEWQGEQTVMSLDGILPLTQLNVPESRSWVFQTADIEPFVEGIEQPFPQSQAPLEGDYVQASLTDIVAEPALAFTVAEIGRIAASIVLRIDRSYAVQTMPGYSVTRHNDYADYYDRLREAMNLSEDTDDLDFTPLPATEFSA